MQIEVMQYSEELSQRIGDCRELYLKYGGKRHELIEKEMRVLGHSDFHRRILYRRFERGTMQPGWIETYGWDWLLKEMRKHESEPPALAGGQFANEESIHDSQVPDQFSTTTTTDDSISNTGRSYPIAPYDASNWPPANAGGSDFDEFKEWLKRVSPEKQWDFKHQVYIYKRLKKITDGDIKRLMIFMPPRHGKSEMVTVRYAAWRLKQDPSMNVIIASYNQQLANRFSRKIKSVLVDDFTAETQTCGEEKENQPQMNADDADKSRSEDNIFAPGSDLRHPRSSAAKNLPLRLSVSAVQSSESPFPFVRSRPKNTEAEWETTMCGGLRAVGVGAGVTGFGADLIIIDDPVKSRAEAESKTCRERLWNWFKDDISTRLEPNGAMILIQTRWHEDDLAGRLLCEAQEEGGEQWTVVNLPALSEGKFENRELRMESENFLSPTGTNNIAQGKAEPGPPRGHPEAGWGGRNPGYAVKHESDPEGVEQPTPDVAPLQGAETHDICPGVTFASLTHPRLLSLSPSATGTGDPLNRKFGEALWPQRFDEQYFDKQKRQIGSYAFASLYQQRPTPAKGGLFKRAWFKVINAPPPNLRWTRGYDLGISKNATADYTASVRVAFDDNQNMYIDGGYRARIEYPEQRRYILGRIAAERDTVHGIELSANGNAVMQDLRKSRLTLGRALRGLKTQGDKVTNALSWIPIAEEGRVQLVRGPWNKDFIEEAAAFPLGTHDDQIDAVSLAVRLHRERGYKFFRF